MSLSKGRKFNPVRTAAIVEAAKLGLPKTMLSTAGGISEGTLSRWLKEGEEQLLELYLIDEDADPEPMTPAHFYLQFQQALFFADLGAVQRIRSEWDREGGAWQAAAWWLERRHPDAFGKKVTQQVVGHDGGTIKIEALQIAPIAGFEVVPHDEVVRLVESSAISVLTEDDE